MDTSLAMGFRFGFMAGAGAATADLLYAGLAVIAGAALAAALRLGSRPRFPLLETFLAGSGGAGRRFLSPQFRIYASVAGNLVFIALGTRILLQLFG